jgi:hypothetical protein
VPPPARLAGQVPHAIGQSRQLLSRFGATTAECLQLSRRFTSTSLALAFFYAPNVNGGEVGAGSWLRLSQSWQSDKKPSASFVYSDGRLPAPLQPMLADVHCLISVARSARTAVCQSWLFDCQACSETCQIRSSSHELKTPLRLIVLSCRLSISTLRG